MEEDAFLRHITEKRLRTIFKFNLVKVSSIFFSLFPTTKKLYKRTS